MSNMNSKDENKSHEETWREEILSIVPRIVLIYDGDDIDKVYREIFEYFEECDAQGIKQREGWGTYSTWLSKLFTPEEIVTYWKQNRHDDFAGRVYY